MGVSDLFLKCLVFVGKAIALRKLAPFDSRLVEESGVIFNAGQQDWPLVEVRLKSGA